MERKQEQEIRDFLEKIGLAYSSIDYDAHRRGLQIRSLFFIVAYAEGDFKTHLKNSLTDLVILCEDYIRKIDEN
ncbi:hypothetical protein LCGC14_0403820 [marine sediment metagenome]|uniref:Uncharacterized protein n=1 Tax=marine sediment metagenome TaxID=412755 RepID=A0A0F9W4U6_9ZZZZ